MYTIVKLCMLFCLLAFVAANQTILELQNEIDALNKQLIETIEPARVKAMENLFITTAKPFGKPWTASSASSSDQDSFD